MKNFLWVYLLILLLVLSACASKAPTSSNAPTSGNATTNAPSNEDTSGPKVTLTYGMWDKNYQPAIQDAINKFKENHPNIDVKIELTPWDQYWTKLDTAATGESLPDIFWMNGSNYLKYASNDMIMPLSEQLKADGMDASLFPPGALDLYLYKDNNYALPFELSSIGLWYNKKIFDDAQVPYPDDSWDWSKLRQVAKQLTDPGKGIWGIAAPQANEANYYDTIYQNNGFIISKDLKSSGFGQPEAIEGLKFWTDFIAEKVSPTAAQMTETSPEKLFESGKIAMIYDGSWIVKEFAQVQYTKDNADVTILPKGKIRANVSTNTAAVINAKTKYPKEAWALLKYLSSKDAALIYSGTGSFIPAVMGTQDGWVKSIPFFKLQTFIDSATQFPKPYPYSKNSSKWFDVETEYLTKAWAGQMSIEDAAKQIEQKANELLAQE